jgi:20S proteasome alpha/beta subunit
VNFQAPGNESKYLPRDASSTQGRGMTAIVALRGVDHVLMMGDGLVTFGDRDGLHKRSMCKLREIDGWVVGVAGDMEGVQVVEEMAATGNRWFSNNPSSIYSAVSELASCTRESYKKKNWKHGTFFLLAGLFKGTPSVWQWEIRNDEVLSLVGPDKQNYHFSAIGSSRHGALYFADKFHNENATVEGNVLLAYHCLIGIAEQDRRVDHPFCLAVITKDGINFYGESELIDFSKRSQQITDHLTNSFSASDLSLSKRREK